MSTAPPLDLDKHSTVISASLIYAVAMTLPNVTPALMGLFAQHRGLGGTQLGLVGAAYPLGLGIVAVSSYLWVRLVNWRTCISLGMVVMGAAIGFMAIATSFGQLLILMLVAGLGGGAAASPSLTALGDGTHPQKSLGVMIFASIVLPAATIAAVPAATSALGYGGTFFLLTSLNLAALVSVIWHPRSGRARAIPSINASNPSARGSRAMLSALAAMSLFVAGFVAAWYFFERIGDQSGLAQSPMLESLAMGSLIGGVGAFLAIALGRLIGIRRSFVLAIGATIVSLLCLELLQITLLVFFLVAAIFQLWVNVNFSNIMSLIAMNDAGGRFVAMIPGLQSAGAMVGSVCAGLAFDWWGRGGVVTTSITAFLLCAVLMRSMASTAFAPAGGSVP